MNENIRHIASHLAPSCNCIASSAARFAVLAIALVCAWIAPRSYAAIATEACQAVVDSVEVQVLFPIGKSKLDLDYKDNGAHLAQFINRLRGADADTSICQGPIIIRGYASPDGGYRLNQRLALERANNLAQYLRQQLQLPDSMMLIENGGIDWVGLYKAVGESSLPNRDVVQEIIKNEPVYTYNDNGELIRSRKQVLMNLNYGRTWTWMMENIYPSLRSSTSVACYIATTGIPQEKQSTNAADANAEISQIADENAAIDWTVTETTLNAVDSADAAAVDLFRYPALAVRSNLLYDVFYMPNYGGAPMPDIQLEYFMPGKKFSVLGEFTFPYWEKPSQHKYFKIHNYRLEGRYYFKHLPWLTAEDYASSYTGWYAGIYANANRYTIALSGKKGWKGDGWGAGVSTGYVVNLSGNGRWKLDFTLSLGMYTARYDRFVYGYEIGDKYYYDYDGELSLFRRRNHRYTWIGPTNIGITISYTLFYKRAQSYGLGFSRKEVAR